MRGLWIICAGTFGVKPASGPRAPGGRRSRTRFVEYFFGPASEEAPAPARPEI